GIALAQVRYVAQTTCVAELRRADAARLKPGCRAVETLHYYPPNRLYVTVSGPQATAVAAALAAIPFVTVTNKLEDYTDRVLRVEQAGGELQGWLINMEGRRFLTRYGATPAALVEALRRDLSNAYIIKQLAMLDNPNPPFKVTLSVDGDTTRMEGQTIVFKVRSEKAGYLNLIDCGTSGEITVLYPNAFHKNNYIEANREYLIPASDAEFEIQTQGPAGRELVKAIVTEKPLNLFGFNFASLTEDRPLISRDLRQSPGDVQKMGQTLRASLGADLQSLRARDFRVVAKPSAQQPAQPAQPITVPVAQPVKPPAQQQPVEVTPDTVPTNGWATDSIIITVQTKGVAAPN
ncbi:MAG: DUF4384 domain-containing protein, partial [Armatimonadota bacterium]|nr:DUF4384 domain-containing protein [Armatimonadota bacterium]